MKITILEKNYSVSEKLRRIIDDKFEKLQKFFKKDDVEVTLTLSEIGNSKIMEAVLSTVRDIYKASEDSTDMFTNVDVVVDKLKRQIVKDKDKRQG